MDQRDNRMLTLLSSKMAKKLDRLEDSSTSTHTNTSVYGIIMSTFFQILWLPGGIGILGLILAFESSERWPLRLLGGIVALLLSPFVFITVVGLLVSEGIDKLKESQKK